MGKSRRKGIGFIRKDHLMDRIKISMKKYLQAETATLMCGLIFFILVISLITGGNLIGIGNYWGSHPTINAWKIYEIEKNKLNPFYYDTHLDDLYGGAFVSYWDTPLPYVVSLGISKALTSIGDDRFLAAIKITEFLSYVFSYIAFYLLLREIGISKIVSSLVPTAFFAHRFIIYTAWSVNMPGIWGILFPLLFFIRVYRGNKTIKNYILLGTAFALSFLQNPYYGFFSITLLAIPFVFDLAKSLIKRNFQNIGKYFATFGIFILIVLPTKGPDIYRIYKNKIQDPAYRNYLTKQAYAYRPWYQLLPPQNHFLANFITPKYARLRNYLFDNKIVDGITLWNPDANNPTYLGYSLFFSVLIMFFINRKSLPNQTFNKMLPFLLSLLLGSAIFFRGDIFVLGNHHIAFPWSNFQKLIPLTSLNYFAIAPIIFFFIALGFLVDKLKFKKNLVKLLIFVAVLSLIIADTSLKVTPTKANTFDQTLAKYLQKEGKRRLFIEIGFTGDTEKDPTKIGEFMEIPITSDGRYFQIFHKAKIYAPSGLTWFDMYRYDQPLLGVRTISTILTDKNKDKLKESGIDEIVLLVKGIDGKKYWKKYIKGIYKSKKKRVLFRDGIIFKI